MIAFRTAVEADVDFIAEAITEAEKSGTDIFSYARIFDLSNEQATALIKNAVLENIPGQELCLSGFIIAEIDGEPAGAVCSWIEAKDGIPSSLLKANVLYYFLGKEAISRADHKSEIIDPLFIPREPGTLQIESVYVRNKFRGMGVSMELILEHIKQHIINGKNFSKVQIQLAETNAAAMNAYQKPGFIMHARKISHHPDVLKYLPSNTKIMMELAVSTLINKGLIKI
jgi:ribosomal protein S18 acetylase RimI-like enzyme